MQTATQSTPLELHSLAPEPAEEWKRLLSFVGLNHQDKQAMACTVETLMRRAPELVVDTYNYLLSVPETAVILGWESGADEAHLAERRRFFAIWLARTLGIDTSDEMAYYLFKAGKYHAAHGPRRIHTPPAYVTTSIGMTGAAFAAAMQAANLPGAVIAPAMAGWNKYLSVQLHLMQRGYETARDYDDGAYVIPVTLFARLRPLVGQQQLEIAVRQNSTVADLLRKFFNYFPQIRAEALKQIWHSHEKPDSAWVDVFPAYAPRNGWRVLLNGLDLTYNGGFSTAIHENDKIDIFPPGR
ncbi:MAG: protoglobin domain-containing protein [Chloroflexota bacterium]